MMVIPDEAKCNRQIVHEFTVIGDYPDAQIERCIFCNEKVIFNKCGKGRVDNAKYYRYHLRDYLQPRGSMYELYVSLYGKEQIQHEKRRLRQKGDNEKRFETMRGEIQEENSYYNRHPSKE